jgi:hypothetical protein
MGGQRSDRVSLLEWQGRDPMVHGVFKRSDRDGTSYSISESRRRLVEKHPPYGGIRAVEQPIANKVH